MYILGRTSTPTIDSSKPGLLLEECLWASLARLLSNYKIKALRKERAARIEWWSSKAQ